MISLAGYVFVLPAGFHVSNSSGARVTAGSDAARVRLQLQSPAPPPPAGASRVTIGGSGNYWFLRARAHEALYVYFDVAGRRKVIIIQAVGMSRQQLFGLVRHHGIQAGVSIKNP